MSEASNSTVKSIDPVDAIEAAKNTDSVENTTTAPTSTSSAEVVDTPSLETANTQAPSTATTPKPTIISTPKAKPVTVNKTPVTAATTSTDTMDIPLAQKYMKDYISRYLTINDGILDSEAKKKQAIEAFKKICYHAINNASDMVVLDMVLDMFKQHRNRVLSEELALQGLHTSDKSEQMKVSVFYRLFYDFSNPKRKKGSTVNMEQVRSIFGNDDIVNYLVRKFPK
jgi:hypothetical protein